MTYATSAINAATESAWDRLMTVHSWGSAMRPRTIAQYNALAELRDLADPEAGECGNCGCQIRESRVAFAVEIDEIDGFPIEVRLLTCVLCAPDLRPAMLAEVR